MDKSCYDCDRFSLCRLRDRARELIWYFNKTGNFMGGEFHSKLHTLMGSSCSEFKKREVESEGNQNTNPAT